MISSQQHRGEQQIRSDEEALRSGYTGVRLWLAKIEKQRDDEKEWRKIAREATHAYDSGEGRDSLFNLFHSNIETLVPALYNSTPIPDVRRRYAETDRAARLAAETIERFIVLMLDGFDFDGVMRGVVQNGCVAGRGVMRVRYFDETQEVRAEMVPWDRLIVGPGRVWSDVKWIAFEDDLTEEDLLEQFGIDKARLESLGFGSSCEEDEDKDKDTKAGIYQTVRVYEIWDMRTKKVMWIADRDEDDAKPLKMIDDPYGLREFFPIPEPFQQIRAAGSLIPRCQYKIYKPLLDELDTVSNRIRKLIEQLRVRGVADPRLASVMSLLQSAADGEYVAAQNSETFILQGNKLADLIDHFPMEPIVVALQQLYVQRDQIKQQIYEVTGISDIMRGHVNPNEKLGQSQMKAQSMSVKLSEQQKQIQRLARDVIRMMAHLALNVIPFEVIVDATRMDFAAQPAGPNAQQQPELEPEQKKLLHRQTQAQVQQIIESGMRHFMIDIETDSTIRSDLTQRQETYQMMLQGAGQFLQAIASAQQVMPDKVPALMKVFQAFLRQFQFPKDAEDALESMAEQPPPEQQEDPRLMEMQQQMEQMQQELQSRNAEMEKHQMTIQAQQQLKQMELENRLQVSQQEMSMRQQEYIHRIGVDAETDKREDWKAARDVEIRMMEIDLQRQKLGIEAAKLELGAIKEEMATGRHAADIKEKRSDRRARNKQKQQPPQVQEGAAA